MCSFEDVFGHDFGSSRPISTWDKPFFNNQQIVPTKRFVAWVDLMGAANHMLLSLPNAACFVGKVHDAGLQASSRYASVSLHPIADGFYAIGENWGDVRDFTSRAMRSLAWCFDRETDDKHKFLVRAGIAYGWFIDGTQMTNGSDTFGNHGNYMNNVIIGSPLAWAYKAEGKAPPFGIYIDQSVTTHSGAQVAWVLHRWWQSAHALWAKQFGGKVKSYLEWMNSNAIATRYPVEKHGGYVKATTEFFQL